MASTSKKNTFTNGSAISENHSADTVALLPHLESLERIIKLPVVGAAWDKGQDVYGKVKGESVSDCSLHLRHFAIYKLFISLYLLFAKCNKSSGIVGL